MVAHLYRFRYNVGPTGGYTMEDFADFIEEALLSNPELEWCIAAAFEEDPTLPPLMMFRPNFTGIFRLNRRRSVRFLRDNYFFRAFNVYLHSIVPGEGRLFLEDLHEGGLGLRTMTFMHPEGLIPDDQEEANERYREGRRFAGLFFEQTRAEE